MISIIIPIYNGAQYIENILSDLSQQTFQDFEIIIVNDGSTDLTLSIVLNVLKKQSNIKKYIVIDQQNMGVSVARNAGIAASKGEIITFIDVDDNLASNYLFCVNESLKTKSVEVFITDHSNNKNNIHSVQFLNNSVVLKMFLYGNIKPGAGGLAVKAELLLNNNIKFAEGYNYGEDFDILYRLISISDNIALDYSHMYRYNIHENSAMRQFTADRFHTVVLAKRLEVYFKDNNPTFYILYHRYAVARVYWSILWQAVIYYNFHDFLNFIIKHPFDEEIAKLLTYDDFIVRYSSYIFLKSKILYYYVVRYKNCLK